VGARLTAQEVIDLLQLAPLAGEGGYFRQTLSTPGTVPGQEHAPVNTAILFLVTPESWSGLHKLVGDEMFHFYMGDPCRMVVCSPDGTIQERRLGTDLAAGCEVQVNVPGGTWQGTMLAGEGEFGYALLGTTMTPGFRPDQFELGTEATLAELPADVADTLRPFLSPEAR
jgi:uncharacterized protein